MREPDDDRFDKQVIDAAEDHLLECGLMPDSIIWTYGPKWTCKICDDEMSVKTEVIPLAPKN